MKKLRVACLVAPSVVATLLATPATGAEPVDALTIDFAQVRALADDGLAWVVSDDLQMNVSAATRLVVPNKCERQGERELSVLASEGAVEEAYAFVPALCLWIEIGFSETKTGVRVDTKLVDALLDEFSTLALYHIHAGAPENVAAYFPAYSDLLGLVLINANFLRRPEVKIYHRAVTSIGIFEYAFIMSDETAQTVDRIFQTGLGEFVSQNLAYTYAGSTYERKYYAAVRKCYELLHGVAKSLEKCFPMRTSDFLLQYRTVQK